MVEQSAAASHALAAEVSAAARLASGLAAGEVSTDPPVRTLTTAQAVNPLRGNVYSSGAAIAAKSQPQAYADTWEEF